MKDTHTPSNATPNALLNRWSFTAIPPTSTGEVVVSPCPLCCQDESQLKQLETLVQGHFRQHIQWLRLDHDSPTKMLLAQARYRHANARILLAGALKGCTHRHPQEIHPAETVLTLHPHTPPREQIRLLEKAIALWLPQSLPEANQPWPQPSAAHLAKTQFVSPDTTSRATNKSPSFRLQGGYFSKTKQGYFSKTQRKPKRHWLVLLLCVCLGTAIWWSYPQSKDTQHAPLAAAKKTSPPRHTRQRLDSTKPRKAARPRPFSRITSPSNPRPSPKDRSGTLGAIDFTLRSANTKADPMPKLQTNTKPATRAPIQDKNNR
ncbi:MAG: hypothetical protein AAGJ35_13970, partial [Myxococcota bacterium]